MKGESGPAKSFELANIVDNSSATSEPLGIEPDVLADGTGYQVFRTEGRFVEPSSSQHDIHQLSLDVGEELLEGRAAQLSTGDATVVLLVADQYPAYRALAGNICGAGLTLGVEAFEPRLEASSKDLRV